MYVMVIGDQYFSPVTLPHTWKTYLIGDHRSQSDATFALVISVVMFVCLC